MTNRTDTEKRRLVYELMSRALLDIRVAAYEGKGQKGIYRLADLFHNVPAKLLRLEREGSDLDELIEELFLHADRNGSRPWLDNAVEKIG